MTSDSFMQRFFRDLPQSDLTDDDPFDGPEWDRPTTWDDLLQAQRVLIVSPAGTGKTYECLARQQALAAEGNPSFYLRLEQLATNDLRGCLSPDERPRFDAWQTATGTPAYFFLDSVDELHLVHGDFRAALRRLRSALAGALTRATIIVTARPVPFDRQAFRELLPLPEPTANEPTADAFAQLAVDGLPESDSSREVRRFREVELLPLTNDQIRELAVSQRVPSIDGLLAAIDRRHAWDFARRPQDLIELCDDWTNHGEIRPHSAQLESHVRVRLTARPDRPEPAKLSFERARQGAERLALGTLLTRFLSIRYRSGVGVPASPRLNPQLLLADFEAPAIDTLLQRPLFGPSEYGSVRFAHRSVAEYLAARQVLGLLDSGSMSLRAAKRVLLATGPDGELLVRPSMASTAVWLALWRTDVFDTLLAIEPSVLLIHGDPESLTPAQRASAFAAFVERYGSGNWRGLSIPALQLHRLAQDPVLAPVILAAWTRGIENPEVRVLVLRLVAAGRFDACRDLAHRVAIDTAATEHERVLALFAMAETSDPRLLALVDAIAAEADESSVTLARRVLLQLFPEHLSDQQVIALLERLSKAALPFDYADALGRAITRAPLPVERCASLRAPIERLTRARPRPDPDGTRRGRADDNHSGSILRSLCERLVSAGRSDPPVLASCVLALRSIEASVRQERDNQPLLDLLDGLPTPARRALVVADVELLREQSPNSIPRAIYAAHFYDGPMAWSAERDAAWVLEALGDTSLDPALRAVLLHAAVTMLTSEAASPISDVSCSRQSPTRPSLRNCLPKSSPRVPLTPRMPLCRADWRAGISAMPPSKLPRVRSG